MAGALMSTADYYGGVTLPTPVSSNMVAERASPSNVQDDRFFGDEIWANLSGGKASSPEAAAKVSAVHYCLSIIAVTLGSLPREIRDLDDNIVADSDLSILLDESPNILQTGDEFWSSLAYRAALEGIAFAEPTVGPIGAELWPLDPLRTSVDWRDRSFLVSYLPETGPLRYLTPHDVFWISGLSDGTPRPLTPWKLAKGSIDFALALEGQGRNFFQNGNRLSGVLESDKELSETAIEHLRAGMKKWKNGSTPVLEGGLKFRDVVSNNADAQLVELIKQRTIEMGRYWLIPKSMTGEDGGSKASQEQEALQFGKYVIRPWVRRIEQAVAQRIMTPDQRKKWKFKLNMDALLRADSATQWKNAVLARTAGIASIDDIRTRWFGLPAYNEDWSQDPRAPLNSNRAADTVMGGEASPQDKVGAGARQMMQSDIMEVDEIND